MKLQPYFFIVVVIAVVGSLLLLIGGAWSLLPPAQPHSLTLALSDWPGDQIFAFADQLELDTKYNLALDLRRMPVVGDQRTLWRSGQIDTQIITLDAGFALAESADLRIIYVYDHSFGADALVARNTIRNPAALRRQTIGIEFGFPSHFLVLNVLAKAGLSPNDVTLMDVQFDEVEAAFASGQVAAVATWQPKVNELLAQRADLHILSSSRDFPPLILDAIFVRASVLQANRAAYVNLIRAIDAAIQQCNAHLRTCLEPLAADSGRSVAEWEKDFQGVRLLDLAANQQLFTDTGPDGLAAKLQAVYTFLRANRPEMAPVDMSQWLDGSLVQEAADQ